MRPAASDSLQDLRAQLAQDRRQLAEQLARIREIRELLEARHLRRPQRPEGDAAALVAVLHTYLPSTFYVSDVLTRAAAAPLLRAALEAHRVNDSGRLGAWFRDWVGRELGAFTVTRGKRDNGGVRWEIHKVTVTVQPSRR